MMSTNQLAIKSLRYRKSTFILGITSIALSVILLLGVERIRNQVHESFSSTISGTDLIVGSRTGSVSLLLSSVFHIGYPNQNVRYETYEKIKSKPEVEWALPFSLGDSHKGFPVLGITEEYFEHFQYGKEQYLSTSVGSPEIHEMGAVLGAKVAKDLGYKINDEIVITHGSGDESFISHSDEPFKVAGILKPTGTPVDQTIHVSLFSMDEIHQEFEGHTHNSDPLAEIMTTLEEGHEHEKEPEQVTGFLMGLKNKGDILAMQRSLNTYQDEPLTAIMPVVTLLELWSIVRPIEKALLVISILVMLVSFAGILTTLMTSLKERRREMAVLRSVGAKPKHVFQLIIIEAAGVTLAGIIAGVLILDFLLVLLRPSISNRLGIVLELSWINISELSILGIIFVGGILTSFIPAYRSYQNTLADGLLIKV